jgi:hypothetical protein
MNWQGAMRIKNIEQGLRYLRKIIIYFFMYPAADKRKGFDESLGMRVFTAVGLEEEPAGNLGVGSGEVRRHLTNVCQFALIVL